MPSIYEVVQDVDAALARFDQASSPAEQRRAMREVLAHLYFLHQHRAGQGRDYWQAVATPGAGGDVAQGVIYARGKLAHHVTKEMGPGLQGGDYDPDYYDMRHYCAGTLTWLHVEEMTSKDGPDFVKPQNPHSSANLQHYRCAVAGQPVRDTLAAARDFLVAPPGMPPL